MNWNKLIRPFHYVSGEKALLFGFVGALISSGLAFSIEAHFNGTFNIKFVSDTVPAYWSFIEPFMNVAVISLVFSLLSLVTKKHFRWIDLVGFNLAARLPILLLTAGMLFAGIDRATSQALLQAAVDGNLEGNFTGFMVYSFVSLPILAYTVYLIFHANSTVLNLKKFKGVALFIGGIVLTEIILYFMYSQIYALL